MATRVTHLRHKVFPAAPVLSRPMPRYIDVHTGLTGVTLRDVQEAHAKDLKVQREHGVRFLKFWLDEESGTVFCLSEAPDKDAPRRAHADAHGLLPDKTYEVTEGA